MSKLNIILLDNSNNIIEDINIIRPKTYEELLKQLKMNFKNLPKDYNLFKYDNHQKIIINNNEQYNLIDDKLFINEIENMNKSLFEINYNKLSESKRDILDDKFGCSLCLNIIKKEDPYLCYKCQKIFHIKCLENWDKKCKSKNINFTCPNCRNELPLNNWNKKYNYEDNRNDNIYLINKINEYKMDNNINNIINNKKIEEFEESFKNILNKINLSILY